ncbi:nitroreductase [Schlesneria sp. DSM 10557]|uniref:nitroreductase family protein n=1 Tax=Schlesneria sp. DSM 10557 TaxID=3044399 RepID=UPI00359FF14C
MSQSISEVIRGRRTIGAFLPELPDASLIEAALEVARWAPNHKKTEPWRVYWLGPKTASAITELNARLIEKKKGPAEAEAKRQSWSSIPGWLAVTCTPSGDAFREGEDYAACCCFIQNLMLALWAEGIGSKWATGDVTREPEFDQLLGIDTATERVAGLIWYGYPAVVPAQTRQPVSAFLRRLD